MSEQEENLTDSQSMFLNGSNSVNINDENHLLNSGEEPVEVEEVVIEPVEVEEVVIELPQEVEELIIDDNDNIIENSHEPSPAPVQQRNNRRNNRRNRGNNNQYNHQNNYGNNRQNNRSNQNNEDKLVYFLSFLQPNYLFQKSVSLAKLWFITFIVFTLITCPMREWLRYNYSKYCHGGEYMSNGATDAFFNFVTNKIWYGHDHQCDQYVRWTKAAERMCPIGDLGISREIPTIIATVTLLPTGAYLLKNIFGAPNTNNGNNHGKKNYRNYNRRNN
jgi:hypothetical protein